MDSGTLGVPFTNWKFAVFHTPPRPRICPVQELAAARAIARRRRAGPDFDLVSNRLYAILNGDITKTNLMSFAQKIAAIKGLKVDREAKRVKDSLICWFCENCKQYILGTPQQTPPPTIQHIVPASPKAADPIPEQLWDAWENDFPLFE
jgi:hypothetical protein